MDIGLLGRHLVAVPAVAVLLLAGCSQSRPVATTAAPTTGLSVTAPAAPVRGNQVTIDGFAFEPASLTVTAGTTVTWTNRDEEPHTVAASDGSFHSGTLAGNNNTFSHTFSAPGSFTYHCAIHPYMAGTVEVTR